MKKILMVICALFCFVGCSCKKENKVTLKYEELPTVADSSSYLYSEYGLLTYELKTTEDYDSKIANNDSFLLFVYREGCAGCIVLSSALKDYIDENPKFVLYTLEKENIGYDHTLYKDENITVTPYLILIENGKIVNKEVMPVSKANPELAKQWLTEWVNKNIVWEE